MNRWAILISSLRDECSPARQVDPPKAERLAATGNCGFRISTTAQTSGSRHRGINRNLSFDKHLQPTSTANARAVPDIAPAENIRPTRGLVAAGGCEIGGARGPLGSEGGYGGWRPGMGREVTRGQGFWAPAPQSLVRRRAGVRRASGLTGVRGEDGPRQRYLFPDFSQNGAGHSHLSLLEGGHGRCSSSVCC